MTSSGHAGFDAFCQERFIRVEDKVKLLPDPLGGRFTQVMTPEQAEYLASVLMSMADEARRDRAKKYPELYPEEYAVYFGEDESDCRQVPQ